MSLMGWECPKCGNVWSPLTPGCATCAATVNQPTLKPQQLPSECSECHAPIGARHNIICSRNSTGVVRVGSLP